jgi:D-serine deaminase-like pyridoxal phosphate-dependent protein
LSTGNACSVFSKQQYELAATKDVLIPALLIYRDIVPTNIDTAVLSGNPSRWRPYMKAAKLGYVLCMLTARGVTAFKCATSLELLKAI